MTPPPTFTFDPDGPAVQKLRKRVLNPWGLRAFMLAKLPLGLFAGLRVVQLDATSCEVTVPYGWRTQNPFRSTYFAAQSMAAEMSTGTIALALVTAAPEPVSMLITGMTAEFVKKATDTVTFRCEGGDQLTAAVVQTLGDGQPVTETVSTVGRMPDGTVVARFTFTWSFKKKGG